MGGVLGCAMPATACAWRPQAFACAGPGLQMAQQGRGRDRQALHHRVVPVDWFDFARCTSTAQMKWSVWSIKPSIVQRHRSVSFAFTTKVCAHAQPDSAANIGA